MKETKLIIGIISLIMSVYFFYTREDVVTTIFSRGVKYAELGLLILPLLLFVIGLFLIFYKTKPKLK